MGNVQSIVALTSGPGTNDADILRVINPPTSERDRSKYVGILETPYYSPTAVVLPGHAPYRMTPTIGRRLGTNQIVRSNHFVLDATKIVGQVNHYHVHIYHYRDGVLQEGDQAPKEDLRVASQLVLSLRARHPEWDTCGPNGSRIGITFDCRSALFTTARLPLPGQNSEGADFIFEDIGLPNLDGSESRKRYRITLTHLGAELTPSNGIAGWSRVDQSIVRALDTSLLAFARWQLISDSPTWFLVGSKAFRANGQSFRLTASYVAMRGYYAGLKTCLAGLVLVCDMSVTSFLAGGEMVQLMAQVGGFRDVNHLVSESSRQGGLANKFIDDLNKAFKNCKCKVTHLGHWKKVKMMGPPANSSESAFDLDGKRINVADYFVKMAKEKQEYTNALKGGGGRLKYPSLPTVNVGTKDKPVLVPAELVIIPSGQCMSNKMDPMMTAEIIKHAAVRPHERFNYITDNDGSGQSVVNILRNDPTAKAFGVDGIAAMPMRCASSILPQAKLQYAGGKTIDPVLNGTWNLAGDVQFARAPPAPYNGTYMYGVMVVGHGRSPHNFQDIVKTFVEDIERDAGKAGVRLKQGGPPMVSTDEPNDLTPRFAQMKKGGARIVLVMMVDDVYCKVKLVADRIGQATQCLKWKNIERPPRGYHYNVMLKINTKMGGTNHTLITRLPGAPRPSTPIFQDPPASLSWLFDKPCMLVGMDVSHAEPGSDKESMAAVVASMDGRACQYVAHISSQSARMEILSALEPAMVKLLDCFMKRNGNRLPATIIVYRDGVGDGQFEQVVQREIPAIKGALQILGYKDDVCKIAMVICQKGHHTRLVYEESVTDGKPVYINPCPGLVIDGSGGAESITSGKYNEFYLNSHAAIQGTAKPCKYALVYDEIGLKLSELELLTYWTCYLYCRCNKSVSYCTPAYYAHWASKRAKNLFAAGGSSQDLIEISEKWAETGALSTMFFV